MTKLNVDKSVLFHIPEEATIVVRGALGFLIPGSFATAEPTADGGWSGVGIGEWFDRIPSTPSSNWRDSLVTRESGWESPPGVLKPVGAMALDEASLEQIVGYLLAKTNSFPAPSPYHRKITKRALMNGLFMDVYDIDSMWPMPNSALEHGRKKLFNTGNRSGGKSFKKDIKESLWSTKTGLELWREGNDN